LQIYLKMPDDTLAAMTIENILLYVGIGLIAIFSMYAMERYDRKFNLKINLIKCSQQLRPCMSFTDVCGPD
jgi:hypothetical protein